MQPQSTPSAAARPTFRPRVRRLGPGRYLVESKTRPGIGHPVTVDHCNCRGFGYRGTCSHVALVRAIQPAMERWYQQAVPVTPAAAPSSVPFEHTAAYARMQECFGPVVA